MKGITSVQKTVRVIYVMYFMMQTKLLVEADSSI